MSKTAVFTLVQNDSTFMARWLNYYGTYFDDVFILDHNSVGDALDLLDHARQVRAEVITVHHEHSYDAAWMAWVVRHFHTFLLQSYDLVGFVAIDEFLVPREGTLGDWLTRFRETKSLQSQERWVARAAGYEVVHHRDQEPPLNWEAATWLTQRKSWYPCQMYSKPVIATEPIFWAPGFSNASNVPDAVDNELLLVHLHRIDYDQCFQKHREAKAREWAPGARREGPFRQNLVDEPEALGRWILCSSDSSREYAKLELIPESLKNIV
jgi:hypothetical protein